MTTIPTLEQIFLDILADINTVYGIPVSPDGKAMLRALAAVEAAKLKLFYLTIGNLQKNIWVDTAEPVEVGGTLQRFGFTKLQRYPNPATQGRYEVEVTGTVGATIPALTQFKSDDDSLNPGFLYILDAAFTLASSPDTITIRALTAGTESLLDVGDTLTATAPILNVSQSVEVTAITTDPVNAETIEEYRAKVIQAYQLEPQGGAPADYRLWGLDAAGTRQIYPYAASGLPNEINVFVEATIDDSTDGKGTPTSTILTDVADDIETDPITGVGRRPLGVFLVNVEPIVPLDVDIFINSGGTITVDQQAVIKQAIEEAVYNIRPFIAGIDNAATRNDTISTFGIGAIVLEAIGSVIITSLTMDVDGSTVTSYQFDANGEIPYVNSVNFT